MGRNICKISKYLPPNRQFSGLPILTALKRAYFGGIMSPFTGPHDSLSVESRDCIVILRMVGPTGD